ncbi:MAG: chorismate mutase, partial [Chloroflexi bacterium]|nr:chorismate mutase [Chloroflexota bacterium]
MNLDDLRKKIDETDAQIVRLIAERLRIAEDVGKNKREHGNQIEDKGRERVVLDNVKALARKENISSEDVEDIYR